MDSILIKKGGEKIKLKENFILIKLLDKIMIYYVDVFLEILRKVSKGDLSNQAISQLFENNCYSISLFNKDNNNEDAGEMIMLNEVFIYQEEAYDKIYFIYLERDKRQSNIYLIFV